MNTRPSSAEIIKDLTTTADKIRALAHADYDRSEISKILGIRYQHVRNVMLRSGLTGGMRREAEAEREPVEVDAAPAPLVDTSWKVLIDAGFQFIGEWTQDPESLIRLDAKAPALAGVYAFTVDDIVVYVGLTLSGLKTRFDQYRRGHKGQRTSSRINGRISQTLRDGKKVKVLVATPEPSEWQELPVNTAAGLEVGLIEMIRPSWNIRGAQ
ncbi:MAG: GIY-YIG nuclease family protein [Terracidiphilus sp.]